MDNDSTIKNDTIIIYADYRDPFRQPVMPVIEEKKLTVKPVISPPSVAWPAISYEGTIKNDKQQKMLALLSVAGERMVITEDTEIKGIRIMRIYQDSITVSYQNQRKAFLKNSL
ncbi:MAG TPA: hypothetical protein VHO50_12090 [Bacteroidales bacterium]|nr:hypothetical protein [Bacteroidales bacterium]